jgi:hypothetical protein
MAKNPVAKYRILKITRDESAPMGVDYTPEYYVDGDWVRNTPAMYSYAKAIEFLRKIKAQREVKAEYIYPKL